MSRVKNVLTYARERGGAWTALYLVRRTLSRLTHVIDRAMMRIEEERHLTGDTTVSASLNTVHQNRAMWNAYDWSRGGEEWSSDAQRYRGLEPDRWKQALVDQLMLKYVKPGALVLEIGPGAGRWSEHLQPISARLILADIAPKCLQICRQRFAECPNVEYRLIDGNGASFITADIAADANIDVIWSYDVFVHINPTDIEKYLRDFRRALKPGGYAVIHHVGVPPTEHDLRAEFRSAMDRQFFADLVRKSGLRMVEQDDAFCHKPGDVISVFTKPLT